MTLTYTEITDAEIDPSKPGKQNLFQRLRDNFIAAFQGAAGAPGINRAAIEAGSSGADGNWIYTTTLTGLGFFEPESIVITAPATWPGVVIARVNDDVTISSTLTLTPVTAALAEVARFHMGGVKGNDGTAGAGGAGNGGGGGAHVGSGGTGVTGVSGTGIAVSGTRYSWMNMRPRTGGRGGDTGVALGGDGGPCLILIVDGDIDLTGATINCNGAGTNDVTNTGGAGAGGTIILICTGTITGVGATLNAHGGAVNTVIGRGGGGGGGYIAMVASAYATAPTTDVTGSTGGNPANTAGSGTVETVTLTEAEIRSILLRSY